MSQPLFSRTVLAPLFMVSLLSGCGGGSGNGSVSETAIEGSAFAAAVSGASCTVVDEVGATVAGPVLTSASGSYRVVVDDQEISQSLRLLCEGGSYVDEATGESVSAGRLSLYLMAGSLRQGGTTAGHVTPGSTIIHDLVVHHDKTVADAQTLFSAAFGYLPDSAVAPTDATSPAAGASDSERLAGLRAATFSQLTTDLGLSSARQFDLLVALAQDLADGQFDGAGGGSAIMVANSAVTLPQDMQHRYSRALINFRNGNDSSGLGNDQIGTVPFATVVVGDSYRVEYLAGTMAAMEGQSKFQLRVTDAATGTQPQTGLALSLMPMMYMAQMSHSSPVDGCSESASPGTYDCTLFYLMPSSMNGMSMGYWDLKVTIAGTVDEVVHFYPEVMMAMGDTPRARLKGVNDTLADMSGNAAARDYLLFKSALTGVDGNHSFKLFIAAKESMMSFPPITSSTVLNSGSMSSELTISSVSVQLSSDTITWVDATELGNGYWLASAISGLSNGVQGQLYVKLSVNGEQKSTDGQIPAGDGTNDYATFTITPASM